MATRIFSYLDLAFSSDDIAFVLIEKLNRMLKSIHNRHIRGLLFLANRQYGKYNRDFSAIPAKRLSRS